MRIPTFAIISGAFLSGAAAGEPGAGDHPAEIATLVESLFQAQEKVLVKDGKADEGIRVDIIAAPDAFASGAASAFMAAVRSGATGRDLIARLRAAAAEWKPHRDKVLFTVTLTASGDCFLTGDLRKHLVLGPKSLKAAVIDVKPTPNFETWKTFVDSMPGKASLAKFGKLTVRFTVPRKEAKRRPIAVAVMGIVSQRRSASRNGSINPALKQISFKRWEDITLPPSTFSFEPARWEGDPPAELGRILEMIGQPGLPAIDTGPPKAEKEAEKEAEKPSEKAAGPAPGAKGPKG